MSLDRLFALATIAAVSTLLSTAEAETRMQYEDETVVERSELIVIGHLKEGSITYVPHQRTDARSWEHHATLVVAELLKGSCAEKEIPVTIHYGLDPVVGGELKEEGHTVNLRGNKADYPKDIIEIIDAGNTLVPLVKDARDDHIWFLRKRSGVFGREPSNGNFGIVDPEDLKPLSMKDYMRCYLSDDPERALAKYAAQHPEMAEKIAHYRDHRAIQQSLKIEDLKERYQKLLPYFLKGSTWNMKPEARDAILTCGRIAGAGLMEIFRDPQQHRLRQQILLMWRDIGYRKAVPEIVEMLKEHDTFWMTQELQANWWNDDSNSALQHRRQDVFGETYYGVCALRSLKSPVSRDVLQATLRRWKNIQQGLPKASQTGKQIVEECAAALREIPMPTLDEESPN